MQNSAASATFRSISERNRHIEWCAATGGDVFEGPLEYVSDKRLMKLAEPPRLKVKPRLIYSRESTLSYVTVLGSRLVCKIFHIPNLFQGGGELLEPFEVEARYLKIFGRLLTDGIIDGSVLLLGTCTMTREQVKRSGYLPEGIEMFPEKTTKRMGKTAAERSSVRTKMYAIIFAEAGDTCMARYLIGICERPDYSRQSMDYVVRVMLLQIVFTLASIHNIFPSYKHLDLHVSNWLVQTIDASLLRVQLKMSASTPLTVEYSFRHRRWQVSLDRAPFRSMLWDMNLSSINPEDVEPYGIDLVTGRLRQFSSVVPIAKAECNQVVDIAKTVDSLRWVLDQIGKTPQNPKATRHIVSQLAPDLQDFFERIVPAARSCMDVDRENESEYKSRLEHVHRPSLHAPTPLSLLDDPIFDVLRVSATQPRPRPIYRLKGHNKLKRTQRSVPERDTKLMVQEAFHAGGLSPMSLIKN